MVAVAEDAPGGQNSFGVMSDQGSRRLVVHRPVLAVLAVAGLAAMYVFQDAGVLSAWLPESAGARFVITKVLRFLVNDLLMLGLILSLFPGRGQLQVAVAVQMFGALFLLTPYLILKVVYHAGDGPLISFLHRLVINPMLMLLLIPGFYFYEHPAQINR